MSKPPVRAPPGLTELCVVVSDGEKASVDIMGVVHDLMPARQTRGTDVQMTFVLKDKSISTDGLRIRFFRKSMADLPRVNQIGDVVLLRKLKIARHMSELIGLSTNMTEHIVFPLDSDEPMKSATMTGPSNHEVLWAKSLRDFLPFEAPKISRPSMKASQARTSMPPLPLPLSQKDRFALIKDITAGDRGVSSGNFFDLAGEVVKMFWNSYGYLDLYLCDYTVNKDLHDYGRADAEGRGQRCPSGRMTLHVELNPPHGGWALENVKEGDFVRLQNVRIKWNQKGVGQELEGNMWCDKFHPDKVLIRLLPEIDNHYVNIKARRKSYWVNVMPTQDGETKSMKKRKRKQGKETKRSNEEQEERQAKRVALRDSGIFLESDNASDLETTENRDAEVDVDEEITTVKGNIASVTKKLNPNIKCDHHDIPWSSFEDIIDVGGRKLVTSSDHSHKAPFNNIKHHAKLRVMDFFPHRLRDFAIFEPGSYRSAWQWCFWLVLAPEEQGAEQQAINVLVHGQDAEQFLQIQPVDLSRNNNTLRSLEQRLFLLWGDLAEQKDKFLHSHPNIDPDEDFSLRTYNISASNRPFECCVAEYGVLVPPLDGDETSAGESPEDWMRVFKLFGTTIMR